MPPGIPQGIPSQTQPGISSGYPLGIPTGKPLEVPTGLSLENPQGIPAGHLQCSLVRRIAPTLAHNQIPLHHKLIIDPAEQVFLKTPERRSPPEHAFTSISQHLKVVTIQSQRTIVVKIRP